MPKPGRLSREEQKWVLQNRDDVSVEEMAVKLGKTPELLYKFLRENRVTAQAVEEPHQIRQELRDSEEWKRLKLEFTSNELKLFEEKYVGLMAQFKGNVLASEELQIVQAIKYIILMSRNMIARSKSIAEIARLETVMNAHLARVNPNPAKQTDADVAQSLNLESQLQAARASEQAHTNEYVKLQDRYDKLMTSLKATRDQRVKDIESSKVSFLGLVKMLQQREMQEAEGRSAELMRLAAVKEFNRLGQMHTYEDGQVDRPMLTPETVMWDE